MEWWEERAKTGDLEPEGPVLYVYKIVMQSQNNAFESHHANKACDTLAFWLLAVLGLIKTEVSRRPPHNSFWFENPTPDLENTCTCLFTIIDLSELKSQFVELPSVKWFSPKFSLIISVCFLTRELSCR